MKNIEEVVREFESKGHIKTFRLEFNPATKQVSTYTERVMEEYERTIRYIDQIYESTKEALEMSFDKKEITSDVYFTLCEIRLHNYLRLISEVESKRDAQLTDRWGL